ncbi:uncharacterized protein LOC144152500 isoform X2 [Haemaphysalis longicornis]
MDCITCTLTSLLIGLLICLLILLYCHYKATGRTRTEGLVMNFAAVDESDHDGGGVGGQVTVLFSEVPKAEAAMPDKPGMTPVGTFKVLGGRHPSESSWFCWLPAI